ncbi:MAG: hypothetical protein L3K18_02955, partial [Thermoplasmata archaeon]|nr:hypothetical protein [Thermoplasmata archaeon]
EATFTRIAHDPAFLDAVHAIQTSGTPGGTLTVPGADKWLGALTGENAFAPYATTALLFYPAQQLDSQLAYFALAGHFSVTNGEVDGSVHGTAPAVDTGVPSYASYEAGVLRPILRVPPSEVELRLHDAATGATFSANLTVRPTVVLPNTATGPMEVSFAERAFWFNVSVTLAPTAPGLTATFTASARPPFSVDELDVAVSAPLGSSALCWPNPAPGSFLWTPAGAGGPATTYGNVTPITALREATSFDPGTGGPAARLAFVPAGTNGTATVGGALALATPSAAGTAGGVPGSYSAPAIWQTLGVRFVLWWSATAPGASPLFPPSEASDLAQEYGLGTVYENSEWVVLALPPPLPAPAATTGATG